MKIMKKYYHTQILTKNDFTALTVETFLNCHNHFYKTNKQLCHKQRINVINLKDTVVVSPICVILELCRRLNRIKQMKKKMYANSEYCCI